MQILVTGATGFIGRTLCRLLHDNGHDIVATIRDPAKAAGLPPVTLHQIGNIDGSSDWRSALAGCQAIIHLAARVHAPGHLVDAMATARSINRDGTANLARQAAEAGVSRFLFCSTVKVYGNGRPEPYSDCDQPRPAEAYAISKWEAEQALAEIAASSAMTHTVVRPPLVYGPGVGANFLRLLRAVERGMPLPFGSIKNQRSIISVTNLASLIEKLLTHPRAAGQTITAADNPPVSTPELIRLVAKALGRKPNMFPVPRSILATAAKLVGQGDKIEALVGSLSITPSGLLKEIGWQQLLTLEEGLAQTTRWYLAAQHNRQLPGRPPF